MKNGEVQLVFNTTEGAQSYRDSYSIRRTALVQNIPVLYDRVRALVAAIQAIRLLKSGRASRRSGRSRPMLDVGAGSDPDFFIS
jgi:hypothetical protein